MPLAKAGMGQVGSSPARGSCWGKLYDVKERNSRRKSAGRAASEMVKRRLDEGRAVDIVYLYFSKAFDTVSHNILIDKLMKYGLDKLESCWAQSVAISSTKSS